MNIVGGLRMDNAKIIETIENYEYMGLGFKVILPNVQIIQDRSYIYPQIDMQEVMINAAIALVYTHKKLDGARLQFIRRFMDKNLDQFCNDLDNISRSSLVEWEKNKTKICDLTEDELRKIYIFLRKEIMNKIETSLDAIIASDFKVTTQGPLEPIRLKTKFS